jgi:carboxyl-terminal processing protease
MIRLTVARYYTPSGRCIQKPYDNDSIKYEQDLMQRYNSGELTSADSIHFPDSLKTYTKRLGRPVYGGGGIMPDYFVPLDTLKYTKYHRALAAKGSIVQASLKYLDANRENITKEYKDINDFDKRFEVDEAFIRILNEQSLQDKVKLEGGEEEYRKSLPEIKTQLKHLIARDIWDMEEFMQIYNRTNDMFLKAYELVKEKKFEKLMQK